MISYLGLKSSHFTQREIMFTATRHNVSRVDFRPVLVLKNGSMLVTEEGSHIVWQVSKDRRTVVPFAGISEAGSYLDPDDPTQTSLREPLGTLELENGIVVIADIGNARLVQVEPDKQHVKELPPNKCKISKCSDFCRSLFVDTCAAHTCYWTGCEKINALESTLCLDHRKMCAECLRQLWSGNRDLCKEHGILRLVKWDG